MEFKEVIEKFPNELREPILSLIGFFREEYAIKREEFEKIKVAIEKLAIAQEKTEERLNQLAIAQQKTEERVNQLAIAQQKTEERLNQLTERVNQLAIAQQKTEERLNQLAIAQQKTEERLNQLAIAQQKTEEELRSLGITVKRIQKELGGISHSIGFDLENQAYKALPKLLKERYEIIVENRLIRKFLEYPDGKEEEINIFGYGKRDSEQICIIGEAKTHLSTKDVDKFKKNLKKIETVIKEEKFPIFVVHSASPKVIKYAENNGFPVFFSYEF